MFKYSVACLLFSVCATHAHAAFLDKVDLGSALVSGFISKHHNTTKSFNENNYGVGHRFEEAPVIVGYYKNSENKDSVYAVYESRWLLTKNLHVGLCAVTHNPARN